MLHSGKHTLVRKSRKTDESEKGTSMKKISQRAKKTRTNWTAGQIAALRQYYANYTAQDLAELLGKTVVAVRAMASSLGVRKHPVKPVPPLVDVKKPTPRSPTIAPVSSKLSAPGYIRVLLDYSDMTPAQIAAHAGVSVDVVAQAA
jgi:hypothetical protein